MAWDETRRSFIEQGAFVGGCLVLCPLLARRGESGNQEAEKATYVFDERMSYCCAVCTPERCKWLSSDMDFKRKKAAELREKLGRTLSPEEITCSRCRVDDARAFDSIKACPIRQCVLEKKLLSCAHCRELEQCQRIKPVARERSLAVQRVVLADSR